MVDQCVNQGCSMPIYWLGKMVHGSNIHRCSWVISPLALINREFWSTLINILICWQCSKFIKVNRDVYSELIQIPFVLFCCFSPSGNGSEKLFFETLSGDLIARKMDDFISLDLPLNPSYPLVMAGFISFHLKKRRFLTPSWHGPGCPPVVVIVDL